MENLGGTLVEKDMLVVDSTSLLLHLTLPFALLLSDTVNDVGAR